MAAGVGRAIDFLVGVGEAKVGTAVGGGVAVCVATRVARVVAVGDDVFVGATGVSVGAVVLVAVGWVPRQEPSSNDVIIKHDKTKPKIRVLVSNDLLSYCKRPICLLATPWMILTEFLVPDGRATKPIGQALWVFRLDRPKNLKQNSLRVPI